MFEAEKQAVQRGPCSRSRQSWRPSCDARASAEARAAEAMVRCRDAEHGRAVKDAGQQKVLHTGRPRGRPRKIVAVPEDMASPGVLAFELDIGVEEFVAGEAATVAEPGAATWTPEADAGAGAAGSPAGTAAEDPGLLKAGAGAGIY